MFASHFAKPVRNVTPIARTWSCLLQPTVYSECDTPFTIKYNVQRAVERKAETYPVQLTSEAETPAGSEMPSVASEQPLEYVRRRARS
ncbi:hypothetical protein HOLleu_28133 [Holothuria leucospilota]|uniref:Uncharacterized protein n=1 Tax=Holothuria leucospilota TaxID=206669 RepID=A0A9Q1BLJ4_HOLLE|nr:hypothetical protein HOLleu_28133 [Holothuria leucospilota]